jgi:hypothetical protein
VRGLNSGGGNGEKWLGLGSNRRGRPLFIGEFNLLIAKVDSRKILAQTDSKS